MSKNLFFYTKYNIKYVEIELDKTHLLFLGCNSNFWLLEATKIKNTIDLLKINNILYKSGTNEYTFFLQF